MELQGQVEETQGDVGQSQADDEHVGDRVKLAVAHDDHHDQNVGRAAKDDDEDVDDYHHGLGQTEQTH